MAWFMSLLSSNFSAMKFQSNSTSCEVSINAEELMYYFNRSMVSGEVEGLGSWDMNEVKVCWVRKEGKKSKYYIIFIMQNYYSFNYIRLYK